MRAYPTAVRIVPVPSLLGFFHIPTKLWSSQPLNLNATIEITDRSAVLEFMRGSSFFYQWGGGGGGGGGLYFWVALVPNLLYSGLSKFYFKENFSFLSFQTVRVGPTFSRGVQHFRGGYRNP